MDTRHHWTLPPRNRAAVIRYVLNTLLFISLATTGCVPSKIEVPAEKTVWPSREVGLSLEDRQTQLEVVALTEIVRARVQISRHSWQLLQDMIRNGLARLEMDGMTPEGYGRAEINLRRFVLEEIAYALEQDPLYPRIGEGTFDAIISWICPLYPFC